MIPVISDVVATPSNALETVKMTMDQSEESVLIAMRSMENNYTDSSGATVREYATNALDAHMEAGVTRPIEITTPTYENPSYIVRDFGCGMTRDFLLNNFSKYRFSTKRGDKNANGMYGLGSKAALSEVNAFSIESISEGYKTFARIYKSEDGSNVSILSHDKTDEPSGTRIIINIGEYKVEEYQTKIAEFFYFWNPETVLIDGQRPKNVTEDNYQYVNRFGYIENTRYRWNATLRILQGNVVYAVNGLTEGQKQKLYTTFPNLIKKNVILEVPNGTLSYTDSREGIVNSADNLAKIGRHIGNMQRFMFDNMEKDLNNETNPWKALSMMESYKEMFGAKSMENVEYAHANLHLDFEVTRAFGWTPKGNRRELNSAEFHKRAYSEFPDIALLVTNDEDEYSDIALEEKRKALTALKPYVHENFDSAVPVYCVNKSSYELYKDDALFKSMVEMDKVTVLETAPVVAWHKAYKIANRSASKRSGAPKGSTGVRGKLTYPVRFKSETRDTEMTLDELKEHDIKRLFVFADNNYSRVADMAHFGFSLFARKGDALVTISSTRSIEAFEKRAKNSFNVVSAVNHFKPKLEDSYLTYSDSQRIASIMSSANGAIMALTDELNDRGLMKNIKSPFLSGFKEWNNDYKEIRNHNFALSRYLDYGLVKNDEDLYETDTLTSELNKIVRDIFKHYGMLLQLFVPRYIHVLGDAIEFDWNEMVDILNDHYEKNGDPKLL